MANTNVKRYPFSQAKHAHDVEFLWAFLYNRINGYYSGDADCKGYTKADIQQMEKKMEKVDELREMFYSAYSNGQVVWLTGKQYGLAKEITAWASEERANRCRPEYRQYC